MESTTGSSSTPSEGYAAGSARPLQDYVEIDVMGLEVIQGRIEEEEK